MDDVRRHGGPGSGVPTAGAPRRAVRRWAWRLLRVEWRAHLLSVALLTTAVAVGVAGAEVTGQLTSTADRAVLGGATELLRFVDPDPDAMALDLAAVREQFPSVEIVREAEVPLPGVFDPLVLRNHAADGRLGGMRLALLDGRLPTRAAEVALTDGAAELLEASVGSAVSVGEDTLEVVGLVENPFDLTDEFGYVADLDGPADVVSLLVEADTASVEAFRAPSGAAVATSGRSAATAVMTVVVGLGVMLLGLVAMGAVAVFGVVARRRRRQLGLLAAIGGTPGQVKRVLVLQGLAVGAIAAAAGTGLATGTWRLLAPRLEGPLGQRVASSAAPWWSLVVIASAAVGVAALAAWVPARQVASTPVVAALTGRPAPPRSTRATLLAGTLAPLVGIGLLVTAGDPTVSVGALLSLAVGTVAVAVGVVARGPDAVSVLGRVGARAGVAVRIAFRDLARYRSRSGAALGVISLILGLSVAVVLASTSAVDAASEGNLRDDQLMLRVGDVPPPDDVRPVPQRSAEQLEQIEEGVREITEVLDASRALPIEVAVIPDTPGLDGLPVPVLVRPVDDQQGLFRALALIHLAAPELLAELDVDPSSIAAGDGFATSHDGEVWLESLTEPPQQLDPLRITAPYTSLPATLVSPQEADARGWHRAPSGWLVDADAPVTAEQFDRASQIASSAGLTVERRRDQADLAGLRDRVTALAALASLAIVAMAVGLLRTETRADAAVLAATGAPRRTRRTITAATAGGLAALGALLGTSGAYLSVGAVLSPHLDDLLPVPAIHLFVIAIGIPLVATGAAWAVAGRWEGDR